MDENKIYRWVTHGHKNCQRCAELDGKEMSFAEWFSTVLPGIHAGCDCSLEPVEDASAVEPGLVFGQLKSRRGPMVNSKLGIDERITQSFGALKPAVKQSKARLPASNFRPINIAHYGG
jgi:hypothetical protein